MISIGKLAASFGLSRTALLYYDRIGLLRPTTRTQAGYRLYDEAAVSRLQQICSFRNAGLRLEDIDRLLNEPAQAEGSVLSDRLEELDRQIADLRVRQRAIVELMQKHGAADPGIALAQDSWVEILKASGMNKHDRRRWHQAFERDAPEAHHSFLRWLGISEEEISNIRERSGRNR